MKKTNVSATQAFFRGMLNLFGTRPSKDLYIRDDNEALENDWLMVGNDLWGAIHEFERENAEAIRANNRTRK